MTCSRQRRGISPVLLIWNKQYKYTCKQVLIDYLLNGLQTKERKPGFVVMLADPTLVTPVH